MRFQCEFYHADGKRCEDAAFYRLFLSQNDPFNFIDTCMIHRYEYKAARLQVFNIVGELVY